MSALLDSFANALQALPTREAAGLGDSRRAALDAVLRDGIPHARVEAWKYTPLRSLERRSFAPTTATSASFDEALLAGIPAPRIVFVNGRFDASHSDVSGLPQGASLQALSQVLASGEPRESNFLARRFDRADEIFARLNAALADDGAVLRLDAGVTVASPVHLVFIGAPAQGDLAWHLRHLIELAEGAALTLVEHQLGQGAHQNLANALAHVHLAANATLSPRTRAGRIRRRHAADAHRRGTRARCGLRAPRPRTRCRPFAPRTQRRPARPVGSPAGERRAARQRQATSGNATGHRPRRSRQPRAI